MKTIRREEPIIRNRFTECPHCKTRNFKVKKTLEVGRCRNCRESYKIITVYIKTGAGAQRGDKPRSEGRHPTPEHSLPSWQVPSDSSLFGSTGQESSTFSSPSFAWNNERRDDESETTSGQ